MYKKIKLLLGIYSDNPTVWYNFYQEFRVYSDEVPLATKEDLKAIDDRSYYNEMRFV